MQGLLIGTILAVEKRTTQTDKQLVSAVMLVEPQGNQRKPRKLLLQTFSETMAENLKLAYSNQQRCKISVDITGHASFDSMGFEVITNIITPKAFDWHE